MTNQLLSSEHPLYDFFSAVLITYRFVLILMINGAFRSRNRGSDQDLQGGLMRFVLPLLAGTQLLHSPSPAARHSKRAEISLYRYVRVLIIGWK